MVVLAFSNGSTWKLSCKGKLSYTEMFMVLLKSHEMKFLKYFIPNSMCSINTELKFLRHIMSAKQLLSVENILCCFEGVLESWTTGAAV